MTKYKSLPTAERLWELFEYQPLTGDLIWKTAPKHHSPLLGQKAGTVKTNDYRRIIIDGKRYQAHRLVWVWIYGEDPADLTIDHINHNKSDNRISNLRLATQTEQTRYRRGTVGAYLHKASGRYMARIRNEGHAIHLGYYDTVEEASAVYHKKAREVFGEFYCEPVEI